MRSLILGCSSALLFLVAAPASAAQPVTTGETDSGIPEASLVIVAPADGAVLDGSPDASVEVTIEYEVFFGSQVSLVVDDQAPVLCSDNDTFTCTLEVTLAPGLHTLRAEGDSGQFQDSHQISIEVKDVGAETEGPATDSETGESATDTAAESESEGESETANPTTGPTDPTGTTSGGDTDAGSDGDDTDGGGSSGDKEGCGCNATPGAPDLLGLALLALVGPWRRRRRA
ncbi:MYXO-CTERM sorting domain-containing protein [Nannocystis sp. SCPEA4]|uniref:MYXO-CTERM sorting domain-containing protein n=1 Tax=Nannocystis sp. SCPEA4 TaxID=2996787 RepID=UPI00226E99B4|nr:MYXO-CTERM sorting domain-containing protein [Nannocystis sp. SCPEA4]MCY1061296.1 MYXO-CTERM sorting domain-containing protein [Nannocystis sp. SCPEA4]